MPQTSSIINIFTYRLPRALAQPIYNEYEYRIREIQKIWSKGYPKYLVLQNHKQTIESLLAISLFYKYIIGNLCGAAGFYQRINVNGGSEHPIKIGAYILDKKEYNKILAIQISFNKLQEKYQLSSSFFEFSETIEFLKNCIDLYNTTEYETNDTI